MYPPSSPATVTSRTKKSTQTTKGLRFFSILTFSYSIGKTSAFQLVTSIPSNHLGGNHHNFHSSSFRNDRTEAALSQLVQKWPFLYRSRGGSRDSNEGIDSKLSMSTTEEEIRRDTTPTIPSPETKQEKHPPILSSSGKSITTTSSHQFLKSEPDNREYRSITLKSNNLEVLLCSDPQTDVEAGAVHVRAGHFNDPPHRAGLAHFHEHMLFLGTEKYPEENSYESFLNTNGGSTNAYTDMEDTNYYFSVAPLDHDEEEEEEDLNHNGGTSGALSGALDRFAQFFVSPLFREDAVERELRAIDSEHSNSLGNDAWRGYQLLKSESDVNHPFHKFGCGNYDTLSGNYIKSDTAPREDLVQFWKDNYHASNIKLCVLGRASLDELQATVEETFSNVPSQRTDETTTTTASPPSSSSSSSDKMFQTENSNYNQIPPFGPAQLGLIRHVVPVKDNRSLKFQFATPPTSDPLVASTMPQRSISHLLGHESPGSLHYLLNNHPDGALINGLSSGTGVDGSDFSLFSLALSLTPLGVQRREDVINLCWQWIALIRSTIESQQPSSPTALGNDDASMDYMDVYNMEKMANQPTMEEYHEELKHLSQIGFRFRENGDPTDFCSNAAELLFECEPWELLAGKSIKANYNATVVKAFMERFTPENTLITINAQDFKADGAPADETAISLDHMPWKKEQWYGAEYRQMRIPDTVMENWANPPKIDGRLKLPALNQFIPTDFTLRCEDDIIDAATKQQNNTDSIQESQANELANAPPELILQKRGLRLWQKTDSTFKVPKMTMNVAITSPELYKSPRAMTLARLFQKVLYDDLNSYVYDAGMAGCSYRIVAAPSGFRIVISGYNDKLPILADVLLNRITTLISEMQQDTDPNSEEHTILLQKFNKATVNLLRETKNYRLDSPVEVAMYNSRILMEEKAWHVHNYIDEMEGSDALLEPLTMKECGNLVQSAFSGRVKVQALCIGNIDKEGALDLATVLETHIFKTHRPLGQDETPKFRSLKLPTDSEAKQIYGKDYTSRSIPTVVEEVAYSPAEENHAVEITMQTGCDYTLGYEGVAIMELLGHLAYPSAYNRLRTKEQLGYIVSSYVKTTVGGGRGLSIEVQSNTKLPHELEERCEAWLASFRTELEEMSEEDLTKEAAAVVAQFLERNMKLSHEANRVWTEIQLTELLGEEDKQPVFDRLKRIAAVLTIKDADHDQEPMVDGRMTAAELKQKLLDFFDKYLDASSSERRAMSSRIYGQKAKDKYEENIGKPGIFSKYEHIRHLKQFLGSYPLAPYWK
mmetsp:Transcript_5240/g.7540  ORF Transcript_5240/g.7540 Transcript_5240/m.7540 type:complete len:1284 (-) Transcript_5240:110-3961(-)